MITYDVNQLADMKSQFINWLETSWCACDELRKDYPDLFEPGETCVCYGRDEYDECHLATIDDVAIVLHYGDRTLTRPHDDPANAYITCGALEWVGDDCDYYGAIIEFIAAINNK